MSIPLAFLRRDALIWSSYPLAVVWQALGIFTLVGLVYFVGATLGDNPALIAGQSGSLVAFVLSGIAFTDVLMQGLYSLPQAIRENQKAGTLEPVLLTPITPMGLALSSALFKVLLALGRMVVYLGFGALVLGYWHEANILSLAVVFIPAAITFVALGALSAAFIILVKEGDPVVIVYSAATALLSGVFFPVEALPGWLQPLTTLVPLTHALAGLRAALDGAPPVQVATPVLALLAMAVVLLPLSVTAFNWAINRVKQEGSLAQY